MAETMEWEEIKPLTAITRDEDKPFSDSSSSTVSSMMELIMMEVDTNYSVSNIPEAKQLVVVPDTNIFIHSLDLVRTLLRVNFDPEVRPKVVLPWAVLQELDGLRKGVKNAQIAINYINELLVQKHPQLRPQKPSELAIAKNKFQESNEDDSILQCALYSCDRVTTGVVVFVTNDKNLRNKSMVVDCDKLITCDGDTAISKIRSYINLSKGIDSTKNQERDKRERSRTEVKNSTSGKSKLKRLPVIRPLPVDPVSKSRGSSHTSRKRTRSHSSARSAADGASSYPDCQDVLPFTPLRKKPTKAPSSMKCETFSAVTDVMQSTVSHIIESQMKEDFGENWLKYLKISPPWTFETGVKCILSHWIAVFSFVFGRKKELAEQLYDSLRKYKKSSSRHRSENEEEIIELSLALLNAAEKNNSKVVDEAQVILGKEALLDYLRKRSTEA